MKSFVNRKTEISQIKTLLNSKNFEFGITYGRRRVGKTALHLHSTSDYKTIYFLARKQNNVRKFKETIVKIVPEARIISEEFESLFEFLKDKVDCIIIDEFPNLIEENANFLNDFQVIVDTILQDTSLTLFLLGSSISLMKSKVLSNSSPLYGRKTYSQKLSSLPFYELYKFYPGASIEEIIQTFGLTDGIPYYINQIKMPFWKSLDEELKKPTFIRDEGEFVVRYEFINSGRYFSILEAIAHGKTEANEISQYTNIKNTSLPPYLHNLQEVEFIKKEISITEKHPSKRGIYVLTDNFLKFWFHYIYPNYESIDQSLFSAEDIQQDYSDYMGPIFEKVVKQFLVKYHAEFDIPKFLKIGRWWWKGEEIDLIAYSGTQKGATLIECKWKSNVNAKTIAISLIQKEKQIQYSGKIPKKTHTFMIFAKTFFKKITELGEYKVICVDIKDLEKIIKGN